MQCNAIANIVHVLRAARYSRRPVGQKPQALANGKCQRMTAKPSLTPRRAKLKDLRNARVQAPGMRYGSLNSGLMSSGENPKSRIRLVSTEESFQESRM